MATYTDNYNLEKPAQTDLYDVDVFNENMDKVDEAMAGKASNQSLAPIESSSAASQNYAVGQLFVYNGLLYKATAAIAAGGTITPGTNCTQTSFVDQVANNLTTTAEGYALDARQGYALSNAPLFATHTFTITDVTAGTQREADMAIANWRVIGYRISQANAIEKAEIGQNQKLYFRYGTNFNPGTIELTAFYMYTAKMKNI